MPAKRELSMRQLRHLLRLHHDGVSAREIGRRLGVARSTIQDNLKRAAAAGLKWPLARRRHRGGSGTPALWARRDCDRPAAAGRAGLGGFGARAEATRRDDDDPLGGIPRGPARGLWLQPVLRPATRVRKTADAGDAPAPCRRRKGVRRLFRQADRDRRSRPPAKSARRRFSSAVLGASNLTYAEATWTQQLPDWTGAHVRMFRFFGGAPKLLVPDNLKSGVNKASFYDPEINRTYGAMARITRVGILPARPRQAEGQSESRGRRQIRPDLHSRAVAPADVLLARRMQRGDRARHATHERAPHAQPRGKPARAVREDRARRSSTTCPPTIGSSRNGGAPASISIITSRSMTSSIRFRTRSSAPRSTCAITARTVEIFHRGQRVGVHQRRYMGRKHGTDPDHMPSSHRRYAEWTPERFRRWAGKIGPNTEGLISAVLASRPHPEQGFRTCLGILRSYRGLDPARISKPSRPAPSNWASSIARASPPCSPASATRRPRTAARPRSSTTPICAVPATTIERKSSCSLIPRSTN